MHAIAHLTYQKLHIYVNISVNESQIPIAEILTESEDNNCFKMSITLSPCVENCVFVITLKLSFFVQQYNILLKYPTSANNIWFSFLKKLISFTLQSQLFYFPGRYLIYISVYDTSFFL